MKIVKELQGVGRFSKIANVAAKHGLGYLFMSAQMARFLPFHKRFLTKYSKDDSIGPKKFKEALEDLGGTFIKLGQILSLRPDLIPIEYCNELAELQDNVKPMDFSIVKQTIESELEKPIEKVFRKIVKEPVGSGSIAQVHEAELLDGTRVAIKVQRPGIKGIFERDIRLMYKLAKVIQKSRIIQKRIKRSHMNLNFISIVTEFEEYSKKELNFFREIKNIKRSYDNFKNYPNVRIPKVYFEYCTQKMIVMDFMDGVKLNEIENSKVKFDKKVIAESLIEIYLKQGLDDGFFHADLHHGNIMVCGNKCITLLDFGIFGSIDPHMRSYLMNLLGAIMEEDAQQIFEVIIKDFDTEYGKISASHFKEDLEDALVEWNSKTAKHKLFTEIIVQIVHLCAKHGIKMPENMVLFSKGLYTIEATCLRLNPKMDFVEEIRPSFEGLLKQRGAKEVLKKIKRISSGLQHLVEDIPEKIERIINQLDKGVLRISFEVDHKELDDFKKWINQIGNRIIYGAISAGLIIASALMINVNQTKVFGISWMSLTGFIIAGVIAIMLILSNKWK